jgi:hypothetical protein
MLWKSAYQGREVLANASRKENMWYDWGALVQWWDYVQTCPICAFENVKITFLVSIWPISVLFLATTICYIQYGFSYSTSSHIVQVWTGGGVGYDFCNTCQFWVLKKIQNHRTARVLCIWKFSGSKNSRFWVFENFQNQRTIGFHERAGRDPTILAGHLIFLIITVINFDTQLDTQWRFGAISYTHPTSGMNHEPQVCHPLCYFFSNHNDGLHNQAVIS